MKKYIIAVGHAIERIFNRNAMFAHENTRENWMRWRY